MAKRSTSPDKLTIKGLSQEDQDWLRAESDRLGCDPENLVRMMIRQRSAPAPLPPTPPNGGGYRHYDYDDDHFTRPARSATEIVNDALHSAGETINEAEPSLDALMSAPPVLDEPPASPPITYARRDQLRYGSAPRKVVPMASPRTPYPRGGFDAFTETEFVGINQSVLGSNMMGDGAGNVMRDNLRHFGVVGTRSR